MIKTESTVRNMLTAIEAPLYDIGVLSDRGMLPGLDGISAAAVLDRLSLLKYRNVRGAHIYIRPSGEHRFTVLDDLNEVSLVKLSADGFKPCAVVETSAGNFQAWLKHSTVFPKPIGTFVAQTLAGRYDADPSAADWRRFGRLPGFTNCKPKYRKADGLFPFVRLRSHTGQQYSIAEAFQREITKLYEAREQEQEARRLQSSLSPRRGKRLTNLSLERFRTSTKYLDRPAAADIAFCVAAYANGMTENSIERALEDDYLSRDPSTSKRAAYIGRTMEKARRWAER
jgi:hypothetical protein